MTREAVIKIADCNSGGWGEGWKGVGRCEDQGQPGKCLREMIPRDVLGRKIHLETERERNKNLLHYLRLSGGGGIQERGG